MCEIYTGYHGTSEIEHGLCACTVDNPLAKARGLSIRTGAQTMLYLSIGGIHCNVIEILHARLNQKIGISFFKLEFGSNLVSGSEEGVYFINVSLEREADALMISLKTMVVYCL